MPSISIPISAKTRGALAPSVTGSRTKVLHLINHFQLGGTERQAVLLLQHLDRNRYDVCLAALSTAGPLFEEVAQLYSQIEEYPLTSFYNYNALKQAIRLRAFLRKNHIQIIHTHEFWSGLLAVVAAGFTDTKVIASQRHLRMSDRKIHLWGRRVLNRVADRVLVNAEAIRAQILEASWMVPAKVVVVRNGLPQAQDGCSNNSINGSVGCGKRSEESVVMQRSARSVLIENLGISDTSVIVGTVANLRPVKGHRYLIDAAVQVLQAYPHVHFVFIGEGDLRSALEGQVKDLGISDHVHFMGHRTNARFLAAGFDLSVLASLHEGMPNTVLEAMSAGVPVIATAVGGVAEIIVDRETGLLVPPGDAAAMAHRLQYAIEHDDVLAAIGMRGYQFVHDTFGVDRMIASVQSLYDEMLNVENGRR